MAEINVTPLVDVMLVLLVIFMVTSPMMITGVSVDLPESDAKQITNNDEPLAVTIDKKGTIYLQEQRVELGDLITKLNAILHQKHDARIYVRGDRNIDYGKVMHVVGAINHAGYTKVALITDQ